MSHYEQLFPVDVSFGSSGGPTIAADIARLASKSEKRNVRWSKPLKRFVVSYANKRDSEWAEILALWHLAEGNVHSFNMRDWSDWRSSKDQFRTSTITATDCPLKNTVTGLTQGDGSTTTFQARKRYTPTGSASSYDKDVVKLQAGSLLVAVNGIETALYSVDVTTGIVTFNTAPANGLATTWGGLFYTPVRFDLPGDADLMASLDNDKLVSGVNIPLVEVVL